MLPLTYTSLKRRVGANRDQLTPFSALLDPPDSSETYSSSYLIQGVHPLLSLLIKWVAVCKPQWLAHCTETPNLVTTNRRLKEVMTTNIQPLHDRVIVKRIDEGEQVRGGIIIPDSAKEKPQEGEVIAVGLGKYKEDGTRQALDVKAGDRVLFGKYSSSDIKVDGEELLIMREDEILGIIKRAGAAAGSGKRK